MQRWTDTRAGRILLSMLYTVPWTIIVLRAWRDRDGFKVRVLRASPDGHQDEAVFSALSDAWALIKTWIAPLETAEETEP